MDITPDWPVMLAGFGQRITPSVGVLHPIAAKAIYLRAGPGRLLWLTCDLICVPRPLAEAVAAGIVADTRAIDAGIGVEQICLCASHTHSAPVPWYAGDGAPGVEAFSALLVERLVRVALEAIDSTCPARIGTSVGIVDFLHNRRTRGQPNHVDARVPVLVARDLRSDATRAILFGVGCHPVTLGWDNQLISGDFPGVAQVRLEAQFPGAVALFFNTTEGNVIPSTSPNLDALDPRGYCGGTSADTQQIGHALADAVASAAQDLRCEPCGSIAIASKTLRLEQNRADLDLDSARGMLNDSTEVLERYLGNDFASTVRPQRIWSTASSVVVERDLDEGAMRELMIACCYYLGLVSRTRHNVRPRPLDVAIQVLHIADFDLLALPGEVLVEVGDAWCEMAASRKAFVVGLANAHHRYLPMPAHFVEARANLRYETVTAGLEPNALQQILLAGAMLRSTIAGAAD